MYMYMQWNLSTVVINETCIFGYYRQVATIYRQVATKDRWLLYIDRWLLSTGGYFEQVILYRISASGTSSSADVWGYL